VQGNAVSVFSKQKDKSRGTYFWCVLHRRFAMPKKRIDSEQLNVPNVVMKKIAPGIYLPSKCHYVMTERVVEIAKLVFPAKPTTSYMRLSWTPHVTRGYDTTFDLLDDVNIWKNEFKEDYPVYIEVIELFKPVKQAVEPENDLWQQGIALLRYRHTLQNMCNPDELVREIYRNVPLEKALLRLVRGNRHNQSPIATHEMRELIGRHVISEKRINEIKKEVGRTRPMSAVGRLNQLKGRWDRWAKANGALQSQAIITLLAGCGEKGQEYVERFLLRLSEKAPPATLWANIKAMLSSKGVLDDQ
jgi:hypothetical protein